MLKEMIENFLPWILFFVIAGKTQTQLDIAIITAALSAIFFERHGLRQGFILSWGTLIYFLFMLIFVVIVKNQWVAQHAWLFSDGALAAIAWVSFFIQKPFTMQYAKKQVSPDKWDHPVFIKINNILTVVWGLVFLAGMGLHVIKLYVPAFTGWFFEFTMYVPSLFGIWVTMRFPGWYRGHQV